MASIHANQHGYLRIAFYYQGVRCQEGTRLKDTPANRRLLQRKCEQIEREIALGTFDYAKHFPNGTKRHLFLGLGPQKLLFKDFAQAWLQEKQPFLRPYTFYDYSSLMRVHLLPFFGDYPLEAIDDGLIKRFVGHLQMLAANGHKIGPRRINYCLLRLQDLFRTAYDRGVIPLNPMKRVKLLREGKPPIDPLSFEEVGIFLKTVREDFRSYFLVAFFTGMRPDEQIALKWPQVDFR